MNIDIRHKVYIIPSSSGHLILIEFNELISTFILQMFQQIVIYFDVEIYELTMQVIGFNTFNTKDLLNRMFYR